MAVRKRWRDTSCNVHPLPAAHGGIGAQALQKFAVAVDHEWCRRVASYLRTSLKEGSACAIAATPSSAMRERGTPDLHRGISTFTRALGVSPNISGAYIASTRLGGSENSPALFRRTVYSILMTPLGTYS